MNVYKMGDRSRAIPGLVVMAKASSPGRSPRPIPKQHGPHVVRETNTRTNHEVRHDNPDGTIVRGWHEHMWSPNEADARVIQALPEPKNKTLRGLLKWGLEKWKIEVERKQEDIDDAN